MSEDGDNARRTAPPDCSAPLAPAMARRAVSVAEASPETLRRFAAHPDPGVRAKVAAHPTTPDDLLAALAASADHEVCGRWPAARRSQRQPSTCSPD